MVKGESVDLKEASNALIKSTTTVGIVCADGVVMGADTRVSMDTFIMSTEAVKVFKIDDTLGMAIAGLGVDSDYLVKFLKVQNELHKMEEGKPLTPGAASSLLSILLQESKFTPYLVELLVGGMNGDKPELYSIDAFGGAIKESKFSANGSGAVTAIGYLESAYSESISAEEGIKQLIKSLKIAMRRDSATGNNIKAIAITSKGFKEYTKEEIEKIAKSM